MNKPMESVPSDRPAKNEAPPQIVLGTVPYLNVQPMLWAIEQGLIPAENVQILPEVPRRLAVALSAGAYDTAIVPVFEYFRHPDLYSYIRGPVIATQGAVVSVALYSSGPLESLTRVYLDVSSFTSVHLFQVLAAEKGLTLEYFDTGEHPVPLPLPPGTGWVVIGDPAIAEIGKHPDMLDLGLAWKELTGLPFVFAAWLVPAGVHPPGIIKLLNTALDLGLSNLETIAEMSASRFGVTPEFALRYFQANIHYRLGDEELAGWIEFARLCYKHKLISKLPEFRQYREA